MNTELFKKLRKLYNEVSERLIRTLNSKPIEKPKINHEEILEQEFYSIKKRESVFKKELEFLKLKLNVNTSYERTAFMKKNLLIKLQ